MSVQDKVLVFARMPTATWWHSEDIIIDLFGVHILWEIDIEFDEKVTLSFSAEDLTKNEYRDIEVPVMG